MNYAVVKVGLMGLGEVSFMHEAGYNDEPRAKIIAVCDKDEELAKSRAEPYNAKYYTDCDELIKDKDVQAVDVMLPHKLHYPIAKKALLAGKHVLVEKPMSMKYKEAIDLIQTAESIGVKLAVAENTRYVQLYQQALSVLQENRLGKIWLVRTFIAGSEVARYSDKKSWVGKKRSGGGIIIDAGVHSFYLLKWFFGGIKRLKAVKLFLMGTDAEDNAIIFGSLQNGAYFSSQLSDTAQHPWTERLEIYGEKGVLIGDQLSNPPLKIYNGPMDDEGESLNVEYDPVGWKIKSIIQEVKDFVGSIIENRDTLVNPYDAAYAVKVAEEAYRKSIRLR